jgi:hypothetical protein
MGWASPYIAALERGERVVFRPVGGSMRPLIESGQQVTCEPLGAHALAVGDIVLCRVGRAEYLHLIKALDAAGRCQIGNNRGGINGWISRESIFGRCVAVKD